MRGVLIAIDLETTGLDAADSHIMEIGAARFEDGQLAATYTTLVNPGVTVPQRVTDITGIKNEDLIGAPRLAAALPDLLAFCGDAPLIGHNIDFDLRFLHKQGALTANAAIDTYELAAALLPTAPRYNLNALTQVFGIVPEGHYHRALTDAIASGRLYFALWEKMLKEVPIATLREISRLAQPLEWRGKGPFEAACEVRQTETDSPNDLFRSAFAPARPPQPPLTREAPHITLDSAALQADAPPALTAAPGALAAVAEAYNRDQHLILEHTAANAGHYLLAAARWAKTHGERTLIAVSSENARRHLLENDLPALRAAMGIKTQFLRRRGAYICPARVALMRRQGVANIEELRMLAKILIWLSSGPHAGDGEPPSLRGFGEHSTWALFNAESDNCPPNRCESEMGGLCPMFKDRREAESAHLLIVDHSALAAAGDDPLFTAAPRIVVDEAHLLEDNLTEAAHTRIDLARARRRLAELGGRDTGLIADMLAELNAKLPPERAAKIADFAGILADAAAQAPHHLESLFKALRAFIDAVTENRSTEYSTNLRLDNKTRGKPAFSQVRAAWSILSQFTETISAALDQLAERLAAYREKYGVSGDLRYRTEGAGRALTALHRQLEDCVTGKDSPTGAIHWAELNLDGDRLTLHAVPLQPSLNLRKHVWEPANTALITGSTLRVGAAFDYVRKRLNLDDALTQTIYGEGHGQRRALVYLPTDIPEPANNEDRHPRAVEKTIVDLALATEGRLLVLFSSYTALRQSAGLVAARLKLGDFEVFDQSDGTSQTALLDGFRRAKKAVLLGIRGFWDDVTFSEDELVALVMVRLPFAVPNDPVFTARSDGYDNSFTQYTLPGAVLRFRQSVEGLIEGRARRSVVAVLDRRVTQKEYGQVFLDSLPPSTVKRGPAADLARVAKSWLAGE